MLSATLRTQIVRTAGTEPRKVGVKVGDWAEYEIAYNYTSNDPNPPQYPGKLATEMVSTKVTVLEVNGTKIKFEEIYRFKNGTELYETKSTDLSECYQLGVWFILPNLDPGDTVIQCPTSPVINATLTQEHCGVVREVNYVYQHLKYWSAPNHEADSITHMYWDKNTGFQVEANGSIYITELTEGYITDVFVHLLINETNIWKPDIIVPDDYPSIQQAINAANENDTIFVKNGTYYEHVVVNKTVSLIGECRSTTIIDGNGTDIVVDVRANDTVISGFTIQNSGGYEPASGIRLYHCFNSSVSNNNANNNHKAIYLFACVNCFVNGNTASNSGVGIRLDRSSNCYIFDNNANNNGHGIFIDGSSNITLRKNNMTGNSYNFGVQGTFLQEYIHDIDVSNTVNGKPIIYWINQTDKPVPANAGYVGIVNSTNIVIKNLTLTKNVDGVLFAHTTNSSIQEVAINNNFHGILLDDSRNCFVHDNNVTDNKYGIGLRRSCSCCVFDNNVSSNDYGIGVWFSGSSVYDNNINNNSIGLGLSGSTGCSVCSNIVTNNEFGIKIKHSSNNTIYHNNFINNTSQVYTEYSMNVWDNGYPSGGNYWSDYNGTDSDNDGIGDHPYEIDENNADHFPLMGEFHKYNIWYIESGFTLTLLSNSTISNFVVAFWIEHPEYRTIFFDVAGETGYGFCRLCIPKSLMAPPYTVTIDNGQTPVTYYNETLFDNDTHRWIYFAYLHSEHQVEIIPEFPSFLIVPLLMIATLLVVIVYRRKRTS